MERVCFGRSGIHGWGLFARRNIQEGEMVSRAIRTYFFQERKSMTFPLLCWRMLKCNFFSGSWIPWGTSERNHCRLKGSKIS